MAGRGGARGASRGEILEVWGGVDELGEDMLSDENHPAAGAGAGVRSARCTGGGGFVPK